MAKKKEVKAKFKDDPVSNHVIAKWGNIVESGEDVLASLQNLQTLSISPALDFALGGGLREGTVVIMSGDPKTGKTTTAMFFAAKCQKLGKNIVYINSEARMTKENFIGIKGLDPSKIKIVQTTDEKPQISAENYLSALEYYIKNTPNLVAIVDSVSSMVPQCELDGDISGDIRNKLPKMLSVFLKRIGPDVQRNKAIVICITHNITNTSGSPYAPKKIPDCGVMLQYQAGTNMAITHRGKWLTSGASASEDDDSASGPHQGQIAYWKIKTSAAGGKPMATATSYIRYGIGIDESQEIAQLASELNMIKRAGAWYTISVAASNPTHPSIKKFLKSNGVDEKDSEAVEKAFRFQGIQNVTDFLAQHEDVTGFIYEQIKEAIA